MAHLIEYNNNCHGAKDNVSKPKVNSKLIKAYRNIHLCFEDKIIVCSVITYVNLNYQPWLNKVFEM